MQQTLLTLLVTGGITLLGVLVTGLVTWRVAATRLTVERPKIEAEAEKSEAEARATASKTLAGIVETLSQQCAAMRTEINDLREAHETLRRQLEEERAQHARDIQAERQAGIDLATAERLGYQRRVRELEERVTTLEREIATLRTTHELDLAAQEAEHAQVVSGIQRRHAEDVHLREVAIEALRARLEERAVGAVIVAPLAPQPATVVAPDPQEDP